MKWISDADSQEALAQCIIRNTFSLEKITYQRETGTVFYTSKMTQRKNRSNFRVSTVKEFIAAITQHIPEKSFQLVRYCGWFSNRGRGERRKQGLMQPVSEAETGVGAVDIIDVSFHQPKRSYPAPGGSASKRCGKSIRWNAPNAGQR